MSKVTWVITGRSQRECKSLVLDAKTGCLLVLVTVQPLAGPQADP